MKRNRIIPIILGLLLSLSLGGCFGVNGNFTQVRNEVLNNLGNGFCKNFEYSFGRQSIKFSGLVTAIAADDEDGELASTILAEVSKVQIGIYDRNDHYNKFENSKINFKLLKTTTDKLTNRG